jgi:hypothetical protein
MTTKLGEIDYNGYIVEVHYNPNLKTKPYLIRIYSWNEFPYESRTDKLEFDELIELIEGVIDEYEG